MRCGNWCYSINFTMLYRVLQLLNVMKILNNIITKLLWKEVRWYKMRFNLWQVKIQNDLNFDWGPFWKFIRICQSCHKKKKNSALSCSKTRRKLAKEAKIRRKLYCHKFIKLGKNRSNQTFVLYRPSFFALHIFLLTFLPSNEGRSITHNFSQRDRTRISFKTTFGNCYSTPNGIHHVDSFSISSTKCSSTLQVILFIYLFI